MSMLEGLSLDPQTILGVKQGASAEEVREAFRRKSLKHHPDHGGDEWAFRIVVLAYETLLASTSARPEPLSNPRRKPVISERIRPGVHDKNLDASRIVQVELVWKRYELDDFIDLLTDKANARSPGGSLILNWPDPSLSGDPRSIPYADRILLALNAAFDELRARSRTNGAKSHIDTGRFEARLEYPSGNTAFAAFKHLHVNLKARGLGVRQWTRDITVPRPGADLVFVGWAPPTNI